MSVLDKIFWGNSVSTYLVAIGIAIGSWLLALIIVKVIKRQIIAGAKQTESGIDDLVASLGTRPIFWLLFLSGLYTAVQMISFTKWVQDRIWYVFVVAWGITGAVLLIRLINGLLSAYIERIDENEKQKLHSQVIRTSRSFVAAIIWSITGIFIISNLGFNVSSILAGLGLGGFAMALASKDTMSNIFGSLTILINGPFREGDSVIYQNHEGTVEEIGLRSTRIRTWKGHLVDVPNSMAPTSIIENISRRPTFRELFKLSLNYETSNEQFEKARKIITKIIEADERTTQKALVHFVEFGQSDVKLQIIYWIKDLSTILDSRHEINSKIKANLKQQGVEFAYPPAMTVRQS